MGQRRIRKAVPKALAALVAALGAGAVPLAMARPARAAAAPSATGLSVQLTWSKDLPGVQFRASSPAPAHLDGTGTSQSSLVVGSLDGKVYAFHLADGSAVSGWPVQLDKPVDSSPATGPVLGTGADDVYVGSGTYDSGAGGGYWGIQPSGTTFLHYVGKDPNQAAEPIFSAPALANLDCTGTTDLVAGALGQDTYALNAVTGAVLPGWPLFTFDTVFSSPAVATVGGRTLTFEGGDLTTPKGGVVRAIDGAGQVIWSDTFDDVITSSPAIGDVTGDGQPDLAVGSGFYWAQQGLPTLDSTQLFLIDPATGKRLWSRDLGGFSRSSPALGDLQGNGVDDIVEATQGSLTDPNSGQIWAFDGAGNVLPGWPRSTPPGVGAVIGGVVTADLTAAGYDDVLVPTGDGLYIYDGRSGALVSSLAVNKIGMQSSPLVTRDPNGTLGITITGTNTTTHDGVVFHYEINGGRIDSGSWPMFHHDAARSGSLAGPPAAATGCGASTSGGYRFVAADGGVFDFGTSAFYGSTGGKAIPAPIVGMAQTPDSHGYWLVGKDGSVYSFGDAPFAGSAADAGPGGGPIKAVGMAATPDGRGYWVVDDHGGVYAFGTARFFGSTGAIQLAQPVVGMASTPDGAGYWLVASDGGIFSFGDAAFYGSTGAIHLAQPVVGMTSTRTGRGYWFVASDGGIFSFGDAAFHGSTGAMRLAKPVVGMAATPDGGGYWLAAADGGIFTFGDAPFLGSTGNLVLAQPIVALDP